MISEENLWFRLKERGCCCKNENLVGLFINLGEMWVILVFAFNFIFSKSNQKILEVNGVVILSECIQWSNVVKHPCLLLKMVWHSIVKIATIASQWWQVPYSERGAVYAETEWWMKLGNKHTNLCATDTRILAMALNVVKPFC